MTPSASAAARVRAAILRQISPHETVAMPAPLITADAAARSAQYPEVVAAAVEPAMTMAVEPARIPRSTATASESLRPGRLVRGRRFLVAGTPRRVTSEQGHGEPRSVVTHPGEYPPRHFEERRAFARLFRPALTGYWPEGRASQRRGRQSSRPKMLARAAIRHLGSPLTRRST